MSRKLVHGQSPTVNKSIRRRAVQVGLTYGTYQHIMTNDLGIFSCKITWCHQRLNADFPIYFLIGSQPSAYKMRILSKTSGGLTSRISILCELLQCSKLGTSVGPDLVVAIAAHGVKILRSLCGVRFLME